MVDDKEAIDWDRFKQARNRGEEDTIIYLNK